MFREKVIKLQTLRVWSKFACRNVANLHSNKQPNTLLKQSATILCPTKLLPSLAMPLVAANFSVQANYTKYTVCMMGHCCTHCTKLSTSFFIIVGYRCDDDRICCEVNGDLDCCTAGDLLWLW